MWVILIDKKVYKATYTTLTDACKEVGVSYNSARKGKRKWGNIELFYCNVIKSKGKKREGFKKDIEQTRMNKWREDITYDENI